MRALSLAILAVATALLAPSARAQEVPKDVKGVYLLTDYPAVTVRPGTTSTISLRLQNYGLDPGCKADLNVLAAPSVPQVLRLQQPPLWVVRDGRILARNQLQREFFKT